MKPFEYDTNKLGVNVPPFGQFRKSFPITIAAGATLGDSIIIPTNRGEMKAIGFIPSGTTSDAVLKDYQNVNFNISNNGNIFLQEETLSIWSEFFARGLTNTVPVVVEEGGTLDFDFENTSGISITVIIIIYFYDPKKPSYYIDSNRGR